ncbi:hypothetical protein SNEBB_011123 [Seison nebaliae]|nr:hypothetical protein SNEBB_011123 [Seison nebaliae]
MDKTVETMNVADVDVIYKQLRTRESLSFHISRLKRELIALGNERNKLREAIRKLKNGNGNQSSMFFWMSSNYFVELNEKEIMIELKQRSDNVQLEHEHKSNELKKYVRYLLELEKDEEKLNLLDSIETLSPADWIRR